MNVQTLDCRKVSITVNRQEMWWNFLKYINTASWEVEFEEIKYDIDKVSKVIFVSDSKFGGPEHCFATLSLFSQGYTPLLLGDAIDELEGESVLRNITIRGPAGKTILVPHTYINF